MRVFIALLFENEIRDIIFDMLREVKTISESGNFTSKNNLHLTLQYIGETNKEQLKDIKEQLSSISCSEFDYETNRIKYFEKSNHRIIAYLGVEKNDLLESLYYTVREKLRDASIMLSEGKFTPHITLGRQVRIKPNASLHNIYCNKLILKAKAVSIMESKRVNNTLVYEPLFHIPLT